MCQVGIRKTIVVEVSLFKKWHRNRDFQCIPGMSLAGSRFSGQAVSGMDGDVSLVCCSRMEQGKACPAAAVRFSGVAIGSSSSGSNRERLSTDTGRAGGPTRSSDESRCNDGRAKGSGRSWSFRLINRRSREESRGEAEASGR